MVAGPAAVAIGGLIVGTFLTVLAVPVLYYPLELGRRRFVKWRDAGDAPTIGIL